MPPVEIQQVDAAAQQDVLAVVDGLAGLAFASPARVGRGAAAQKRARFEQIDFESRAAQRGRRSQSGQSAAGNQHATHSNASMPRHELRRRRCRHHYN